MKILLLCICTFLPFAIILETAVGLRQKVQDFESESLGMGAEHSQTVKAAPIPSDYGSKDCAFWPAPTAVSRIIATESWQELCARNGESMYRIKVPTTWHKQPTPAPSELTDTKQAICTYHIDSIRVTIHTFPSQRIEDRISPQAQIARWKQQFESLDPATVNLTPQAYAGYAGLLFEGTGKLKGERMTMMAWSMQLAPEHYRHLFYSKPLDVDRRADFTIKAVGPAEIMSLYRQALIAFARSFELIEEISYP